jgi:hypothetical protein
VNKSHFGYLISSSEDNRARPIGTMDASGVHGAVYRGRESATRSGRFGELSVRIDDEFAGGAGVE